MSGSFIKDHGDKTLLLNRDEELHNGETHASTRRSQLRTWKKMQCRDRK